jgi:predicted CoA-substrate-specific enzyme activase
LTGGRAGDLRLAIGLDLGSTYSKGVLIDQEGRILAQAFRPAGWQAASAARALLEILDPGHEITAVAASGYGRLQVPEASLVITEISAHALGADLLHPGTGTVIDIGGQDTKVIALVQGRARQFLMNDKCAAGTGRFLEMALARLELTLEDLDRLPPETEAASLTSVCAVFAESEMMGLLAGGRPRLEIAKGVAASLAEKTAALAARLDLRDPIVLTGGLCRSRLLAGELERSLGRPAINLDLGFYAGALGAAWAAVSRREQKKTPESG